MLLRRKAQSTAEYAITIGIVVAVVAGIMQVALKGGMRKKSMQAGSFLESAGTSSSGLDSTFTSALNASATDDSLHIYESEARRTNIGSQNSTQVMQKGGAMQSASDSSSNSTSLTVEKFEEVER